MANALRLFFLAAGPGLISLVALSACAQDHSAIAQQIETYHREAQNTTQNWNDFPVTSGKDKSFSDQITVLIDNSKQGFPLKTGQDSALERALTGLFQAYSGGSFEEYKAFRLPPGVPSHWVTNKLGSLNTALQEGKTIALPKAIERWHQLKTKPAATDESGSYERAFSAYVKLYAGGTMFSNYFTGVAFGPSRIVFGNYGNGSVPRPWKVDFTHTNVQGNANADATAPTKFLNLGYLSQKHYSFVAFDDSIESITAKSGTVTVADCFLFIKRQDADGNLPIIVRFYWSPRLETWLPDDLVVCNLAQKGDFWPIF